MVFQNDTFQNDTFETDSGTQFNQGLTASLGFSGAVARRGDKVLTASLSPSSALSRLMARSLGATLSFAAVSYANTVQSLNPIAYWRLGESSGTTAVDEQGSHDGAYEGAAPGATGLLTGDGDTAAAWDATGDQVAVTSAAPLNPTSGIAIAIWAESSNWNGNNRLIQKGNTDNQYRVIRGSGSDPFVAGGNIGAHFRNALGQNVVAQATAPAVDTPFFLVATYDAASGIARLYIDGVEVDTGSGTAGSNLNTTTNDLAIGNKLDASVAGDNFLGVIDEVALFGSLSAQDVADLYAAGTGGGDSATLDALTIIARAFTATLDFSTAMARSVSRSLAATLAMDAAFVEEFQGLITQAFTAALDFSSSASVHVSRGLSGTLDLGSQLVRQTARSLAGSVGFSAAQTSIRLFSRSLEATLDFAGALLTNSVINRAFNATLGFSGATLQRANKAFAASLGLSGAQQRHTSRSLTSSLGFGSAMARSISRSLAGAVTFSGVLTNLKVFTREFFASLGLDGSARRQAVKTLDASFSPSSSLNKGSSRFLGATLSVSASVTRSTARALSAGLSFTGALTSLRALFQSFAATLSFSSESQRSTSRSLTAELSPSSQMSNQTQKALSGLLTLSGALSRRIARALVATLPFTAALLTNLFTGDTKAFNAVGRVGTSLVTAASAVVIFARGKVSKE